MDQVDVMAKSLIIAVAVVLPYAVYKVRQVARIRRNHEELAADEAAAQKRAEQTYADLPALEEVIGDIGFVADEAQRNGGAMLVVPYEVTVSSRPADRELVDALVRDALRRSNLVVTAEVDSSEGRMLECALMSPTSPRA